MRSLYDQLLADGWPSVLALRGQPEDPHLECKEKQDRSTPTLTPEDRGHIAKAICGLANADGGVFLFGVRARSDQGGIDRVQNVEPIADVKRCARNVEETIAGWVEPAVSVVHIETKEEPGTTSGIVLVYVPSSDGGPHRVATGTEQGRYYLRAGSRTEIMPHTILADRFGRRPQPRLRLVASYFSTPYVAITLEFQNEGRGTARQPAIIIRDPSPLFTWDMVLDATGGWAAIPRRVGPIVRSFAGWRSSTETVIYPGQRIAVAGALHEEGRRIPDDVTIEGTLYCLDSPPVEFVASLGVNKGIVVVPDT